MAPKLPSWTSIQQTMHDLPGRVRQSHADFNCVECLKRFRTSNRMIVLVVFIAIYIDNMLTTAVVPVIPNFLFQQEHPDDYRRVRGELSTPGLIKLCEEIQFNTTKKLDRLTNNGTALNETIQVDKEVRDLYYNVTHQVNCTSQLISPDDMKALSEAKLNQQSVRVGLLFASKSAIQLMVNPLVGPLTNRLGYSIPMFTGFVIIFLSTIVFAFGTNYWVLLIARAIQGAGSSCTTVSGMGMIAQKYTDNEERGNAMAVALSGLALGVLIGPPFGGVLYEFLGKEAPFLFLAGLALFDGALQLYVMKPTRSPEPQEGASMKQLLTDPYILVAAGALMFANMGIGTLEPTLPSFMLKTMNSEKWQQGAAFLPASISYMIGTIIFGPLALKMGRWLAAMVGMVLIALSLFVIPFSRTFGHLITPNTILGLAIGMVDSSMMPTMGYLVDLRHISIYGSVYAIADAAFCMGFALGPAVGGIIVEAIGFQWMLWILALVNLLFAPLLFFLRNPPGNEEKMQLVLNDKCPIKYVTYKQTSVDDEEEVGLHESEPIITTKEVNMEQYAYNDQRSTTHTAKYEMRHVSCTRETGSDDSDEEHYDSSTGENDSGDTEGADDSQAEQSSDSDNEHVPYTQ